MRSRTKYSMVAMLILAVAAQACSGGSSPTAPSSGAGLTLVFADTGALADKEALIREQIVMAYGQAARQLPLGGLTIEVNTNTSRIIPGWGVGGFSPSGFRVDISVDPATSTALLIERLPSLTAHEVHHAARYRGPGYGDTLLEAMVSEGLADHYAEELFGKPLPPWVTAMTDAEIDLWLDRARDKFDFAGYNHAAWFFGTGSVPLWAGYAMGFRLIENHKAANPGATAVSLVHADADAFRP